MYNATRQKPNILRRYRTFKPTNYDSVIPLEMGRNTEFANAGEWYIAPVQAVRDRSALERSNWDAQRAELKGADPHSLQNQYEAQQLRKRTVEWIKEHVTFDMCANAPNLDYEMDDGAFRWRLLTDWRDEARWRADVAELLAYWRAEAHK